MVVVGAGIVGVTSALELARRGHDVTLLDAGAIPHPDASSTDISKVVRLDYGDDDFYVALMERALPMWRALDEQARRGPSGEPLFHETGFVLLTRRPMAAGGFEEASHRTLTSRGHVLERLDVDSVSTRFPSWRAGYFVDGYVNPQGGWAESGRVVGWLAARAEAAGVSVLPNGPVASLSRTGERVDGVVLRSKDRIAADVVVVAAGAWTPTLVPSLRGILTTVGQPVLHFAPSDGAPFAPPRFRTWAADIAQTGWYGFPVNGDGIVKVANHGPGIAMSPTDERRFPEDAEARCRAFLRRALPALAEAPVVGRRVCLYCDSPDGDFWIDRAPNVEGLVVAAGGSGHAFKLGPVLGSLVADLVEGGEAVPRFRWRRSQPDREQARFMPRGDVAERT